MNVVSFRDFCHADDADCERMAKWENDPEIRHLFLPFHSLAESRERITAEEVGGRGFAGTSKHQATLSIMILLDGLAVGEMNLSRDPPQAETKLPQTGWVGIVIGEAFARGCGVGAQAMRELESRARSLAMRRLELGVFEHNARAIRFYEKLGFKRLPNPKKNVFFWDGRLWDDLRMLKTL